MRIASVLAVLVLAFATSSLVACGPGRTTFARHPGAAIAFDRTQDAKAVEIADRVVAAAGGAQKWASAKQLRWQQAVTNDGKELLAGEQAWDRWNGRHHARARRPDGDIITMRSVYEDGGHVFMDPGENKRWKRIEGGSVQALTTSKERWEFDTALLFMPFLIEEPGTKLEYAGEQQDDDGKTLDVLKVVFAGDPTRTATYYVGISRETNLPARIEIQKAGKADNERLGYSLQQWSDAGGIKYPAAAQNIGLKGEVFTFGKLSVGSPDETLYVPPL